MPLAFHGYRLYLISIIQILFRIFNKSWFCLSALIAHALGGKMFYIAWSLITHKRISGVSHRGMRTPVSQGFHAGKARTNNEGSTAQFPPYGSSTAPAAAALRIMRYCPWNQKSPGLFWPRLDDCGAECDLFASADREGNPLRVPPAPSGGRRAAHRGIPGYGPPRSGRKQSLPGCCCWGR